MALSRLTWEICLAYLDDLVIFLPTFEKLIERLQLVFVHLKEADLKLKPGKCSLFQSRVRFLGSIASADGIEPDPEKVQAVAEWPRPQNLMEAQVLIVLASYYH